MSHILTPTFWVAVSFIVFIILAWKHLRKAFLQAVNSYRNSISSTISHVESLKKSSLKNLEESEHALMQAQANDQILNAHKLAKEILESSAQKLSNITLYGAESTQSAVEVFKNTVSKKTKALIMEKSSAIVEKYIALHQQEFTKLASQKITQTLKNAKH